MFLCFADTSNHFLALREGKGQTQTPITFERCFKDMLDQATNRAEILMLGDEIQVYDLTQVAVLKNDVDYGHRTVPRD